MSPDEAKAYVYDRFPFYQYMDDATDSYDTVAKTVLKFLRKGDRILDFGSGPCDKTAVVQALGFQCTAYDDLSDEWHMQEDNREQIINFASEVGIDFKLATGSEMPFEEESFEMVMLHDVIEHFHDSPRELANQLISLIKPNGYLFILVPNAVNIRKRISVAFGRTNLPPYESYYWSPGRWRGHVREYVKDDLVRFTEYTGLELAELRSCHHMLRVLSPRVRPFYVALTKVFPGWRDSWLLVAKKPEDWSPATYRAQAA